MYKFVLTWWKNSIKQCFCHQELPCCLISTSSPALNNKTSFAQVMMVQVGTVTTLLVLFGGTVNDYILFMVEHWSCFAKNWGGGGGAKNVIQKSPRKGAGAEKSPNPIFIHPRNIPKYFLKVIQDGFSDFSISVFRVEIIVMVHLGYDSSE